MINIMYIVMMVLFFTTIWIKVIINCYDNVNNEREGIKNNERNRKKERVREIRSTGSEIERKGETKHSIER